MLPWYCLIRNSECAILTRQRYHSADYVRLAGTEPKPFAYMLSVCSVNEGIRYNMPPNKSPSFAKIHILVAADQVCIREYRNRRLHWLYRCDSPSDIVMEWSCRSCLMDTHAITWLEAEHWKSLSRRRPTWPGALASPYWSNLAMETLTKISKCCLFPSLAIPFLSRCDCSLKDFVSILIQWYGPLKNTCKFQGTSYGLIYCTTRNFGHLVESWQSFRFLNLSIDLNCLEQLDPFRLKTMDSICTLTKLTFSSIRREMPQQHWGCVFNNIAHRMYLMELFQQFYNHKRSNQSSRDQSCSGFTWSVIMSEYYFLTRAVA